MTFHQLFGDLRQMFMACYPGVSVPVPTRRVGMAAHTRYSVGRRPPVTHVAAFRAGVAALLVVVLVAGCGHRSPLGPPTPTGATIVGGPDKSSAPSPPPGWTRRPVVPASVQQAQDTIIGYLTKMLRAMPPGTVLDATRYSGGTNTPPCQDTETGSSPNSFTTIGELKPPPGVGFDTIIAAAGEIWKRWGWYVLERDGFYKPNQFGYGPDDYRLQITAAPQSAYPPTLQADSPCFPESLPRDHSPFPMVLRAN
jgi:hypothetical protein